MSDITLTSSMRANLSSLRMISGQMGKTQERLSTGLKVNSAIDNASSYYQARSLTNRASDLEALLDSMGQGIQTIQTANLAIENAAKSFDQLSTIANDSLLVVNNAICLDSSMSATEIQQALNQGGRFVLADDITLTQSLDINIAGTTIIGNGHSITFAGRYGFTDPTINGRLENVAGESALNVLADCKISGLTINYSNSSAQGAAITVSGAHADIDNLTINGTTTANRLYGIQVLDDGKLSLDTTKNIHLSGDYSQKLVNGNPNLWAGEYNTDTIVKQMGAVNVAAWAAHEFYAPGVDASDANFGAGQWYLPSIGELCDLYGYDYDALDMSIGGGTSGATGENKALINAALAKLSAEGADAAQLSNGWYWSSSEHNSSYSWRLIMNDGNRNDDYKDYVNYVRIFQHLENCFYPFNSSEAASGSEGTGGLPAPKIGDVMYDDKTWGSADDYKAATAAGKVAVGVITEVNNDDGSVKIVNLRNLAVTEDASGNQTFDAANPYGGTGTRGTMKWQNSGYTNITDVNDYYYSTQPRLLSHAMNCRGEINVSNTIVSALTADAQSGQDQFNEILRQYDNMIADASYQGINLLKGGKLSVTFNETRSHRFTVQGYKADAESLGISKADWASWKDIQDSIAQLQKATESLRNISSSLGNNYQIIQTRQNFTGALVDVLETGSDNLTLADMNEESANYLALQTRQHLAINSLSLAAQSAQSILSLF